MCAFRAADQSSDNAAGGAVQFVGTKVSTVFSEVGNAL